MKSFCRIVTGKQDGSCEAISKEIKNGYLISPESTPELISSICELHKNAVLMREYGENGRNFVVQNFRFEKFQDTLQDIIKN